MLDTLATRALRLADQLHTRFATTGNPAPFAAVRYGRTIGYDIIRDDRRDSEPVTLVIGLHGFGSDEQQLRTLVPLDTVRAPILYVALRGSWTVVGGGYAWFPIVDSTSGGFDIDSADLDVAVNELHSFIKAASAWPGISTERCWLVGYSQGAPLALHATAERPDLIGGCVAGAGTLLAPLPSDTDVAGVKVLIAASTIDPFVTLEQSNDLQQKLISAGADVDLTVDAAPHVITSNQAATIADWLNEQL